MSSLSGKIGAKIKAKGKENESPNVVVTKRAGGRGRKKSALFKAVGTPEQRALIADAEASVVRLANLTLPCAQMSRPRPPLTMRR